MKIIFAKLKAFFLSAPVLAFLCPLFLSNCGTQHMGHETHWEMNPDSVALRGIETYERLTLDASTPGDCPLLGAIGHGTVSIDSGIDIYWYPLDSIRSSNSPVFIKQERRAYGLTNHGILIGMEEVEKNKDGTWEVRTFTGPEELINIKHFAHLYNLHETSIKIVRLPALSLQFMEFKSAVSNQNMLYIGGDTSSATIKGNNIFF